MSRPIESLSAEEVLALAIHVERANASRFRAFADVFRGYDDEVAAKFEELAVEEDEHEEMLAARFHKRYGTTIPVVEEVEVQGVIEAVDLDEAETMIFDSLPPAKVYDLALAAERGAQEYYRDVATRAEDTELRDLYTELAEMEDEHAGWLEQKIESLRAGPSEK